MHRDREEGRRINGRHARVRVMVGIAPGTATGNDARPETTFRTGLGAKRQFIRPFAGRYGESMNVGFFPRMMTFSMSAGDLP